MEEIVEEIDIYSLDPIARNPEIIFEVLSSHMNEKQIDFCDMLVNSCSMEFICEKLNLNEQEYEKMIEDIKDLQEKYLPGI